MELKMLAKIAVAFSAVVSLVTGLVTAATRGDNLLDMFFIAVGVTALTYAGFIMLVYLVGSIYYISLSKDKDD